VHLKERLFFSIKRRLLTRNRESGARVRKDWRTKVWTRSEIVGASLRAKGPRWLMLIVEPGDKPTPENKLRNRSKIIRVVLRKLEVWKFDRNLIDQEQWISAELGARKGNSRQGTGIESRERARTSVKPKYL
jgi:hypothetical protein